ncbi:MAG: ribosome assembly RNA-binding protein YhbY [Deltaproteobacteria bacterium HGW-Deltaproteobacteria-19]|jgi:RNA-binding protein|nr:MAG: ribosome assembly RNA-binding protein YhbY [Deltaproteobacteria bacterium HGW-Deltaproteobacteria-19]
MELQGFQRKYLRGLAHGIKPLVLIGQAGLTEGVLTAAQGALAEHELIKVKFNDFKEKDQKGELAARIEASTGATLVGLIGHTAIFYRMQPDPSRRRIQLPRRTS